MISLHLSAIIYKVETCFFLPFLYSGKRMEINTKLDFRTIMLKLIDLSNGRRSFRRLTCFLIQMVQCIFYLFNELPNWSVSGNICMGKRCSSPEQSSSIRQTLNL